MESAERLNFSIELILLISAPSSAVAGLWFWETELGNMMWQFFGVIAAFTAVIKPLLSLPKKIKDYESALSGYRILDFDLMELKSLIEQRQKYDAGMQKELTKAIQRERQLVGKTPETCEKQKVKRICEAEVLQELPVDSFFVPEN